MANAAVLKRLEVLEAMTGGERESVNFILLSGPDPLQPGITWEWKGDTYYTADPDRLDQWIDANQPNPPILGFTVDTPPTFYIEV